MARGELRIYLGATTADEAILHRLRRWPRTDREAP
jgi:hypothetical protein